MMIEAIIGIISLVLAYLGYKAIDNKFMIFETYKKAIIIVVLLVVFYVILTNVAALLGLQLDYYIALA